jgi:hypothetical protein
MKHTKYVTFYNLEVSIPAATAKDAYDKLCLALDKVEGEWSSDTFSDVEGGETFPTTDLFS